MQWSSSPYKHTFPLLKICGYNTVATTLSRTAAVSIYFAVIQLPWAWMGWMGVLSGVDWHDSAMQ